MHRTGPRTTTSSRRARWTLVLALVGSLAFPAAAQNKGYAYTYCQANAYNAAQKSFFVFSAPFQALPLLVNGEHKHAEVTEKYELARQDFKRYLQGRGFRLVENGGPRCNSWPPSTVATHEEALANLKVSMDSMVTNMADFMSAGPSFTQHTDFLPSFAKPIGQAAPVTPTSKPEIPAKPTSSGGGIVLDSGPTPAERERHRQEQEIIAQRNLQREKDHALDIQQRFEAKQQLEAQKIRQRVEAIRQDYDRRQAACKAGDTANCYAKVSAQ